MRRTSLSLALLLVLAGLPAYAGSALVIYGKIKYAHPVVLGNRSAILLYLQDRDEAFTVQTADAPKFGLLTAATAASIPPDAAKMAEELKAVIGWRVKMELEAPTPEEIQGAKQGNPISEFRVLSLRRLPEK